MSKVKYDCVVARRYQGRDGEEKTAYTNIGRVIETDKGLSVKLDVIPLGWDGWFGLYVPKPKEKGQDAQEPQGGGASGKDDIPFAKVHRIE